MTGQASRAVEYVSADSFVLVVSFRVGVAGCTGVFGVIGGVRMAIHTSAPFPVVRPAVNREILPVVVERGRRPGGF